MGGAAFELAQTFEEVVAIDYSHSFITVCQQLKSDGVMDYSVKTEGELTKSLTATVNPSVVSEDGKSIGYCSGPQKVVNH